MTKRARACARVAARRAPVDLVPGIDAAREEANVGLGEDAGRATRGEGEGDEAGASDHDGFARAAGAHLEGVCGLDDPHAGGLLVPGSLGLQFEGCRGEGDGHIGEDVRPAVHAGDDVAGHADPCVAPGGEREAVLVAFLLEGDGARLERVRHVAERMADGRMSRGDEKRAGVEVVAART